MDERSGNDKWYKRALRKSLGSDSRQFHSSRPKHTGEGYRWEEHRYPYPPNERKIAHSGRSDSSEIQYYQSSAHMTGDPREFTRLPIATAGEHDVDLWESSSTIDEIASRNLSPIDALLSSTAVMSPNFRSELDDENMIGSQSPYEGGDVFFLKSHCRVGRVPRLQDRREEPQHGNCYTPYSNSGFGNQSNRLGSPDRIESRNTFNHMHADIIEDDVAHSLLPSSILRLCHGGRGHRNDHPASTSMFEGLFKDGYSSSRVPWDYLRPLNSCHHLPLGGSFMEGMIAGTMAGMMNGMMADAMAREHMHTRDMSFDHRFEDQLEAAQEHDFMDMDPSIDGRRGANIMQQISPKRHGLTDQYQKPTVNPSDLLLKKRFGIEGQENESSKAQLEHYNKWWLDVQSRPSKAKPSLEAIPFLSPSSSSEHEGEGSGYGQDWNWNTHKFFCRAFNLRPISVPQVDGSHRFSLNPPPHSTHKKTSHSLHALRAQLKLEKVRWHEDKLRSLFGDKVARDERAKAVWSAVIGLKGEVERVLERGGGS